MKKLLSLFTILGLFGLIVAPIYAQEETVNADEQIVADVEEVVADAEETVEDVAEATVDATEEVVEDAAEVVVDTAEEVVADAEEVVADAEEVAEDVAEAVVAETENTTEDTAGEETPTLETTGESTEDSSFDEITLEDPELVNQLNAWLDEILWSLDNPELTEEFNAQFTTDDERAMAAAGLFVIFASLWIGGLIIWLIRWIIKTIALWKAFTKAWEAGWKAIIPIYNVYIQFKLAGMKNWFWYMIIIAFALGIIAACLPDYKGLITDISCVAWWIIGIVASFKFARNYGWGVCTSVLFVLFYGICILVLGFGSSKYIWNKSEETVIEA